MMSTPSRALPAMPGQRSGSVSDVRGLVETPSKILSLTPDLRRFKTLAHVIEEHSQNEPLKLGRRVQTDFSATPLLLAERRMALAPRARKLLARQCMAAVAGGNDAK